MIVKVQISIVTNMSKASMLIYNYNRSIMYEGEATTEILKLMGEEKKKYFKASLIKDPNSKGSKRIQLDSEVAKQSW